MKTLELKLKKDVLIVDAINEKEAFDTIFEIFNTKNISDYKFLCKGSELTEEIASELVEKFELDFNKEFCVFKDYINDCNRFSKSIPSLISAVESKEKFWLENPIEIIERGEDTEHNRVLNQNEWQEAEEKTFRNPLIFVKK